MSRGGVTAVFAHPDDESLVAAGTLAACAATGLSVEVVSMTRGELGPRTDGEPIGERRERELEDACATLGVSRVTCLSHPDGGLRWIDPGAAVRDIAQRLKATSPSVVITFGSEGLYWHDDHIAVHDMTWIAYAASLDSAQATLYSATWPIGLAAALVARMQARGLATDFWGLAPEAFGVPAEDLTTTVDVSPFVDVKLRALRAHRSQIGPGHLLNDIPRKLAAEMLGREYFVRLAGDQDPLARVAAANRSLHDAVVT